MSIHHLPYREVFRLESLLRNCETRIDEADSFLVNHVSYCFFCISHCFAFLSGLLYRGMAFFMAYIV